MPHRLDNDQHIVAKSRCTLNASAIDVQTIRLKPATKHFLEAQATALNTSVQGLIDLILEGVMKATTDDPLSRLRSIRERFFMLMKAHDLDLPAAVDLMSPFGFTLSALGSPDRLLDLMTPAAIKHLSETFHVN